MKLAQLKEELAAHGSTRTGLKAVLQRRLHGLLVEADVTRRRTEDGGDGMSVDNDAGEHEHEDASFWAGVAEAAVAAQHNGHRTTPSYLWDRQRGGIGIPK